MFKRMMTLCFIVSLWAPCWAEDDEGAGKTTGSRPSSKPADDQKDAVKRLPFTLIDRNLLS